MMNKVFMDFLEDKEFNQSDFIESLGNIEEISVFMILDKISLLNKNDRNKVLKHTAIKNKLRSGLILESRNDNFYNFGKIFEMITLEEFLSLYDSNLLLDYFKINNAEKYQFYEACFDEDSKTFVNYILNDKKMYEDFFFSSSFATLCAKFSYDLLKEAILKMQNQGFKMGSWVFDDISDENQKKIIFDKEFNDDTIIFILPNLHNEHVNFFFKNDPRAVYLYDKFDIDNLLKRGISFNDNIVKKKDFFDLLKKESLIEFRYIINKMEKNNNPTIIEDRVDEYYNEIINIYDINTMLFKDYNVMLNNPGKYKMDCSYVFNFDLVCKINEHLLKDQDGLYYYDFKENLFAFLKKETSKKLSEVIIDALFRDNIYNVWLNIKEMLRYNSVMDDSDKVLDNDRINFYNTFLNFDSIDNKMKIDIYNKYKNKNLSLLFYNDLRKIKDIAYNKIKEKLINPNLHPEYNDKDLSAKYGVEVYDLRNVEFTMLVRTSAEFKELMHYKRSCYSIISNENTQVFGEYSTNDFVYGYITFDNDMVLHMLERDSYSVNFKDEPSRYVNRIMTAEELVKGNDSYSEVQILNENNSEYKYKWTAKKPDFIVVFNTAGERHIKESKRLGIPIVIIKKKKLEKGNIIDVGFDESTDAYVRTVFEENEHRMRR